MRIVLASASPRRAELLAAAGIPCVIDPVSIDETRADGERPERYVERVARLKAESGMRRHPDAVVIGADTAVVIDGETVLGKPRDAADAVRMLGLLQGRAHEVLTGVATGAANRLLSRVERTRVWMQALSDDDLRAYAESGEPLDKAGGYAIQGLASRFIPRIEGSYANVVGLPVTTVVALLEALGQPPGSANLAREGAGHGR